MPANARPQRWDLIFGPSRLGTFSEEDVGSGGLAEMKISDPRTPNIGPSKSLPFQNQEKSRTGLGSLGHLLKLSSRMKDLQDLGLFWGRMLEAEDSQRNTSDPRTPNIGPSNHFPFQNQEKSRTGLGSLGHLLKLSSRMKDLQDLGPFSEEDVGSRGLVIASNRISIQDTKKVKSPINRPKSPTTAGRH